MHLVPRRCVRAVAVAPAGQAAGGGNLVIDDPIWTICIATLAGRREKLARLLAHLLPQCEADGRVEVAACHDNGQAPVAVKRQALLMGARGKYVSFVDDDDTVDPGFVELVTAAMGDDPDYVAFEHVYYVGGVRQPQRVMTGLHLGSWTSTREVLNRDITHINPARARIAQQADFCAPSEGSEDWAYTTTIRRLAVTQVDVGRALYHYFHDPGDSVQYRLAPHVDYPRLEVASPCFRWVEVPS
jgi:hypothetical protein